MFDPDHPGPDYTLRWPRELFDREASGLLQQSRIDADWQTDAEWLLEDAFVMARPRDDLRAASPVRLPGTLGGNPATSPPLNSAYRQLIKLAKAASRLPEQASTRPYYPARHDIAVAGTSLNPPLPAAGRAWAVAVTDLQQRGYLSQVAPDKCVDGDPEQQAHPDMAMHAAITQRLGARPGGWYWPPEPESWDDNTFYSLIEVIHDLVTRPRRRRYHSYNDCGFHYDRFAAEPARILYRWTVNRLLAEHQIPLKLAKSGEDVGRLVATVPDARQELLDQVRVHVDDGNRERVGHAVALFRKREATVEDKRSACRSLFGVLEHRRDLLKSTLLSKDEGALFQIANQFDIRHHRADQHAKYDQAFLDWIFWWYLATIELTNQLINRQAAGDE